MYSCFNGAKHCSTFIHSFIHSFMHSVAVGLFLKGSLSCYNPFGRIISKDSLILINEKMKMLGQNLKVWSYIHPLTLSFTLSFSARLHHCCSRVPHHFSEADFDLEWVSACLQPKHDITLFMSAEDTLAGSDCN